MKYIIFGGNGFVGKYLALALAKECKDVLICDIEYTSNHEVYKYCKYQNIDITDANSVKKADIKKEDVVIHLAAHQYHNKVPKDAKEYFYSVNFFGTKNIIDAMNVVGCTNLIFYSTDMVYGVPKYIPVDIKHQKSPFGYYGESKNEAEELCRSFRDNNGKCTIFRPRIIVGPGRIGILGKLFHLIDKNLPVPTIGLGNNVYQMISVFDCVTATISAIKKDIPNNEFNLGSDNSPTVRVLLKSFAKSVGSKSLIIPTWGFGVKVLLNILNKVGINLMYKEQYMIADKQYIVDISNTKKLLEWTPMYNDEDMLKMAYNYYQKQN